MNDLLDQVKAQSKQIKAERGGGERDSSTPAKKQKKRAKKVTPHAKYGERYFKLTGLPLELLSEVNSKCGGGAAYLYIGLCNKAVLEGSSKFRVGPKEMKPFISHKTQYLRALNSLHTAEFIVTRKEVGKRTLVEILFPKDPKLEARREKAKEQVKEIFAGTLAAKISGVTPYANGSIEVRFDISDQ
jgi:hypothetical protein